MNKPNNFLILGGVISALISLLHVFLAIKPEFFRYIASGQGDALSVMAERGSSITIVASVFLASIFAIWSIYAFSGAGLIGRLPVLRVALVVIGLIYVLRSLFLLSEINMVLTQGYPFRFVIFSITSLVAGLLYLIGFWKLRAFLTINKKI